MSIDDTFNPGTDFSSAELHPLGFGIPSEAKPVDEARMRYECALRRELANRAHKYNHGTRDVAFISAQTAAYESLSKADQQTLEGVALPYVRAPKSKAI